MKVFLQFLMIIFFSSLSFGQDTFFSATYKIKYKPNNYDSIFEKNKEELGKHAVMVKKQFNELKIAGNKIKNVSYTLEFNRLNSLFYKLPVLESDVNEIKLLSIILGIRDEKYYTDKKVIINQKNSYGEDFLVEIPFIKWEITKEERKIGDFICYKAIAKIERENSKGKFIQKVVAWFTPEIPFNYGPKEYSGLPGLIIELKENKNLTFQLTNINKNKTKKIDKPTKGKKITQKEFNALGKKMYENRGN